MAPPAGLAWVICEVASLPVEAHSARMDLAMYAGRALQRDR